MKSLNAIRHARHGVYVLCQVTQTFNVVEVSHIERQFVTVIFTNSFHLFLFLSDRFFQSDRVNFSQSFSGSAILPL